MCKTAIINIATLATPSGNKAKCGADMAAIQVINDACVLIEGEKITAVGTCEELKGSIDGDYEIIDAKGKTVLPGFVDSHTHFIHGGTRDEEFNWRLQGMSYMEIMNKGGGIVNTVTATRKASEEELYDEGFKRLDAMMQLGVTTVEGKSGYGLDIETEKKQLSVMERLNKNHPLTIVPTYMAAHATPAEFNKDSSAFIDFVIEKGLDSVKGLAKFCDVFCEDKVFSIEESRRLLNAAKKKGFLLKIHADEIVQLGGAELAAEVGCVSADHLLNASDEGFRQMKNNGVVATLLPMTAFSLKEPYARARYIIDNGGAVALATDFNPGSCSSYSIPLMIAISAIYMKMSIEEVITALTLNGAAALDMAEEIGSIEKGKRADIIIIDAPRYAFLSYRFGINLVEKVIKNGNIVYEK